MALLPWVAQQFAARWPKSVAKIVDVVEPLLAFYDFPAEHWIHLKTTNPIESTFATVRSRPFRRLDTALTCDNSVGEGDLN